VSWLGDPGSTAVPLAPGTVLRTLADAMPSPLFALTKRGGGVRVYSVHAAALIDKHTIGLGSPDTGPAPNR
jgi:hypothetical protein